MFTNGGDDCKNGGTPRKHSYLNPRDNLGSRKNINEKCSIIFKDGNTNNFVGHFSEISLKT